MRFGNGSCVVLLFANNSAALTLLVFNVLPSSESHFGASYVNNGENSQNEYRFISLLFVPLKQISN